MTRPIGLKTCFDTLRDEKKNFTECTVFFCMAPSFFYVCRIVVNNRTTISGHSKVVLFHINLCWFLRGSTQQDLMNDDRQQHCSYEITINLLFNFIEPFNAADAIINCTDVCVGLYLSIKIYRWKKTLLEKWLHDLLIQQQHQHWSEGDNRYSKVNLSLLF